MVIGGNVTNEDLKNAIAELKTGKNEVDTRRALIGSMICGKFIVPAHITPKPETNEKGEVISKGKYKINFMILTTQNKENYFSCYTDEEEYDKGVKDANADKVILTYKELVPLIKNSEGKIAGFVINPFGESLPITAGFIDRIEHNKNGGGVTKQALQPNSKVKLRTPKYMPVDMLDKAKEIFDEEQSVKQAYIQMMEKENEDEEYLMVLDMDEEQQAEEMFAKLAPVLGEYSFGIKLAFAPVTNPLGGKVAELAEPFYVRDAEESEE
jgi:hypothetical protein